MSTIAFEGARPRAIAGATSSPKGRALALRCPACREIAGSIYYVDISHNVLCSSCSYEVDQKRGVWRMLAPLSGSKYQRFISEYETIRQKEGRGMGGVRYFLSLPYKDVTGRNSWQWKIRGRSYRFVERKILPALRRSYPDGMDILDVGAGNCWMSYRLARCGHRPVAVDLLDNDFDGLGAARHYLAFLRRRFPRFQAEMDCLPFAPGQFDLVIFNASFHYSEDYDHTLQEALRCLRRPGYLLIADSPFYVTGASGFAMVAEKHALFEKRYGFRSDSIASREFLTRGTLAELGKQRGIEWTLHEPWYGMGWALRPWRARLFGRREPSKFFLAWGVVH